MVKDTTKVEIKMFNVVLTLRLTWSWRET